MHAQLNMTMTTEEREVSLQKMQEASNIFYSLAVRANNHAFIEFTGLMNEYIKVCREAHAEGVDFTQFSVHSGQHLPFKSYQLDYINEKLECIFGMMMGKPAGYDHGDTTESEGGRAGEGEQAAEGAAGAYTY